MVGNQSVRDYSGNIRADGTVTAAGKERTCIPTAEKNAQFRKLKKMRENTTCFDCTNSLPTWASVNHGVFLCLGCAATHRAMGVHLTFVRSCDLDEWTQHQMNAMFIGGNGNARSFFRKHGLTNLHGVKIEEKYKSSTAISYRTHLAKMLDAFTIENDNRAFTGSIGKISECDIHLLPSIDMPHSKGNERVDVKKFNASKFIVQKSFSKGDRVLRKPSSFFSSVNMKATTKRKKCVNKFSIKLPISEDDVDSCVFEDIEKTQKTMIKAEIDAKQILNDEALARELQEQLN